MAAKESNGRQHSGRDGSRAGCAREKEGDALTGNEGRSAQSQSQTPSSDLPEKQRRIRALRKKLRQCADLANGASDTKQLTDAQRAKLEAAAAWCAPLPCPALSRPRCGCANVRTAGRACSA